VYVKLGEVKEDPFAPLPLALFFSLTLFFSFLILFPSKSKFLSKPDNGRRGDKGYI